MRIEAATAHSDQSARLDALLAVHINHVHALESGSASRAASMFKTAVASQRDAAAA